MKRVLALSCVFILLASVVVMLVAAFSGSPHASTIFVAALAVNINTYATHIAGLPVAVNIGCHVTRHAKEII